MKKKLFKYIKFLVSLTLILSFVAPSYASLSASDGSAFVTKAEFDSALADFNSRLTTFEAGINSKIDSQVTSYLDRNGIWSGKKQTLLAATMTQPSLTQVASANGAVTGIEARKVDAFNSLGLTFGCNGLRLSLGKQFEKKFDLCTCNKSGLLFGGAYFRDWCYGQSSNYLRDGEFGWVATAWEDLTTPNASVFNGTTTLMQINYSSGGTYSFSTIACSQSSISSNRPYVNLSHVVEIFNKTQNTSAWQMTLWTASPDMLSYACGFNAGTNGYFGPAVGINTAAVYGKPLAFVRTGDVLELRHYVVVGGRNFEQFVWVFGANHTATPASYAGLWSASQFEDLYIY